MHAPLTPVDVDHRLAGDDHQTRKQGYSLPVMPSQPDMLLEYRVAMSDGADVDAEWIIEFSSPTIGHRWALHDEIRLRVAGRS